MADELKQFYAGLTPLYHLIYPDWEKSMGRQASDLDSLIRENWGSREASVLDVSCGIGTQSLGLAKLGYKVTASDLSPDEIERAMCEADKRGLSISFSAVDMRKAFEHHSSQFDLVISCDNSIPHLLTDEDILEALRQIFLCTCPNGVCLISVRDYENEELSKRQVKSCGIREEDGVKWTLSQEWEPHGRLYDLTLKFVEDSGGVECQSHTFKSTYYPIGISKLMGLMGEAGFEDVIRLDGRFFQPIIMGKKKSNATFTMIVRSVTQDDVSRIAEIHVASSRAIYSGTFPDAHFDTFTVEQRILKFTESLGKTDIVIDLVETDGIHGFAVHSATRDSGPGSEFVYELQAIYIDPDQWRSGCGSALLKHVIDRAKYENYDKISLWVLDSNEQAINFYQKWGFRSDGATIAAEVCNQTFPESRYVLTL